MKQLVKLPLGNQETFFTLSSITSDSMKQLQQQVQSSSVLALWQRDEAAFNTQLLKYRVLKLQGTAISFDINPQSLAYLMIAFEDGQVQKYSM